LSCTLALAKNIRRIEVVAESTVVQPIVEIVTGLVLLEQQTVLDCIVEHFEAETVNFEARGLAMIVVEIVAAEKAMAVFVVDSLDEYFEQQSAEKN